MEKLMMHQYREKKHGFNSMDVVKNAENETRLVLVRARLTALRPQKMTS